MNPMVQANAYIPRSLTTKNTTVIPGTLRKLIRMPNVYDLCLAKDGIWWDELLSCGGLKRICCPKGRQPYRNPPWIDMPKEGRQFKPIGIIPVSSLVAGVETTVLTEQVSVGYDGTIKEVVCEVVAPGATGFVEGSGDVTWRLSADDRYLRDLGNIQVTLGSLTSPSPVTRGSLRVFSHDLLKFTVTVTAAGLGALNPNGRIVCSITGWYYPR